MHRDIKPGNILLNLAGSAKISDFGISAALDNTLDMCQTYKGTMCYMSPERINNQAYTFTADIWSVGLALIECALGRYPYTVDKGPVATCLEIMGNPPPAVPEGLFSAEFADFIALCLQKDPLSRPKCDPPARERCLRPRPAHERAPTAARH